jgi:hypothetical protein
LANSKRSPALAAVTRWARDARAVCDLPVVRQTSRPLGRTTYLKPGRLDAVLPLGGSRGGRYAHETAVRVSMRLQKATRPADVSSAHAKAVGAGSDQAATRRRACWNPRTNSCHMCAQGNPQEPVGQATCRTMESLDELWQGLPEYCAPSRGTRWVQRQRQWTQRKPGGLTMPPRTSAADSTS